MGGYVFIRVCEVKTWAGLVVVVAGYRRTSLLVESADEDGPRIAPLLTSQKRRAPCLATVISGFISSFEARGDERNLCREA
jgi:hypothetical protein